MTALAELLRRALAGTTPGDWMFVREDDSCHQAIHAQHPVHPELAGKALFLLVGDSAEAEANAEFVIAARKAALAQSPAPQGEYDRGFKDGADAEWRRGECAIRAEITVLAQNAEVAARQARGTPAAEAATALSLQAKALNQAVAKISKDRAPAPQGEGMREGMGKAAEIADRSAEYHRRQSELRDTVKGKLISDCKQMAAEEIAKNIRAAIATPIPSDRAGREEEIAELKEECARLKREADGEFVKAAVRVMQANPGFNARDYEDGITADDFESFFTEDMKEAWRNVERLQEQLAALRQSASAGIERAAEWHEEQVKKVMIPEARRAFHAMSAKCLRSLSPSASRE